MKIKYNVADIKPEIIDLMKDYVSEEEHPDAADLYWMLVFAYKSAKCPWGIRFFYRGENSYYTGSSLWDRAYKVARKEYKHGKERG